MTRCLGGLRWQGRQPVHVEQATFRGAPALVVVAGTAAATEYSVVVLHTPCDDDPRRVAYASTVRMP